MRIGADGLLKQPVEQQTAAAGSAAVESERVLIQVVGQVFLGRGVVQGASEPPFEQ